MKKNKHKTRKIKPDEIILEGNVSIVRYGELIAIEKNAHKKDYLDSDKEYLYACYINTCNNINKSIEKIQEMIKKFHPLRLLHRGYFGYVNIAFDKTSPTQFSSDDDSICRMVDYIQSIIVSDTWDDNNTQISAYKHWTDKDESLWQELYKEVQNLFRTVNFEFHVTHGRFLEKNNLDYNFDEEKYSVFAQMYWTSVRGNRYYEFEIPNLNDLILPHNDVFIELFGITASDFINGIEKLGDSLVSGWFNALEEWNNLDKTAKYDEEYLNSLDAKLQDFDLFDVQKVSGLPCKLLDELSFSLGEENEFMDGENAGWPLKIFPTSKRPFIKIDNQYYCFDQHMLFDNLYRIIQRIIFRLKPEYKEKWNEIQKEQSEAIACKLFKKLIPKAKIYTNVFTKYTLLNSTKMDWRENDALMLYDDNLIILEVKGGAFTYTSPANDFNSFKDSLKNLMQKPAAQGEIFLDTFINNNEINLYDNNHKLIEKLELASFKNISICCCTLDNFTAFASNQNILKDLGLKQSKYPTWTLSIDDLRVYADIIDSPSQFFHFLERRKQAVSSRLSFNDELDHLALYLKYNNYVDIFHQFSEYRVTIGSHKEPIDTYYHEKFTSENKVIKPSQNIPKHLKDIVDVLDKQGKKGNCEIASLIFDLNSERDDLDLLISKAISRQSEINVIQPIYVSGELALSIFYLESDVVYENIDEIEKFPYSNLLITGNRKSIALIIKYKEEKLYDIDFKYCQISDLSQSKKEEVDNFTKWLRNHRVLKYLKNNNLKSIGRNEKCPCGSGKKYKYCCLYCNI